MSTYDQALNSFVAMGDDEQEPCIHCGKVWYIIQQEDGVCRSCQQEGLPGRAVIAARKQRNRNFAKATLVAVVLIIIWIFFT